MPYAALFRLKKACTSRVRTRYRLFKRQSSFPVSLAFIYTCGYRAIDLRSKSDLPRDEQSVVKELIGARSRAMILLAWESVVPIEVEAAFFPGMVDWVDRSWSWNVSLAG